MTEQERLLLFDNNKPLARYIALKFSNDAIENEDMQQEAYMALWEATLKYNNNNPTNAKFVTYAYNYIYCRLLSVKNTMIYGAIARGASFLRAFQIAKEAKSYNTSTDCLCDLYNCTDAVRIYARLAHNSTNAFISLQEVMCDTHNNKVILGDIIPSDLNLEETVINSIHDEFIMKFIRDEFVPFCIYRYTGSDLKQYKLVVYYFLYNIFVEKLTLSEISNRIGSISRQCINRHFRRLKGYLAAFYKEHIDSSRVI